MASDTQKSQIFVEQPIGNKPVSSVPGIGRAHAQALNAINIMTAGDLLGIYLTNGMQPAPFLQWMMENLPNSYTPHRESCFKALNDYYHTHNF